MSDKTFKCKLCGETFRVKAFTPEMSEREMCPPCYTEDMAALAADADRDMFDDESEFLPDNMGCK